MRHSAETLSIVCDWLYQREECDIDSETIYLKDQEFLG